MKVHRLSLLVYAGIISLCLTAWAEDLLQPAEAQHLPQTVVVKTDVIFNVPFSVTGDVVPVAAGTEVYVKGAGDGYLKLSYGPGELTVDPVQTDFAERMQELPESTSPQVSNMAAISAKQPFVGADSAASQRSDGKAEQAGIPWLLIIVIVALFVAGCLGIFKSLIEGRFSGDLPQRQHELVALGQPSCDDINFALSELDWFQLEKLVAALFRARGNIVEMRGGAKADGGIDLVVDSASTRAAVQCKHWSNWKCGPNVVRELIGSMKHEDFSQGFLVCCTASQAAFDLAAQEQITIVDRDGLIERIATAIDADNEEVRRLLFTPDKLCPKCGAQMIRRTASKGSNVGSEFWGCSKYPECRQTMRV